MNNLDFLFGDCLGLVQMCSSPVRTTMCFRDPRASPARESPRPLQLGVTIDQSAEVRHLWERGILPGGDAFLTLQ